jgi:hypothetical protein
MFAAGARGDAKGFFAPLHARFEGGGHDHEVIDLCFHESES